MSNEDNCPICEASFYGKSYEGNEGEHICKKCYDEMRFYDDCEDNSEFMKRAKNECCQLCMDNDDVVSLDNCEHCFCEECMEDLNKFNKCPTCFTTIDEDKEFDAVICKCCYRQMGDCRCYYTNHLDKALLFRTAFFIHFKETVNHKVLRKILKVNRVYNHTVYDVCITDLSSEGVDGYTVKYIFHSSLEFFIEYYTEREIDQKARCQIYDYIYDFSPSLIFKNLKEGMIKCDTINVFKIPDKIFENNNCPVCLECYDETVIKKIAKCGHITCNECYLTICKSTNSRCPECREVWDDITNAGYTLGDISRLCDEERQTVLLSIVNLKKLQDEIILRNGYMDILNSVSLECIDDVIFKGESKERLYIITN